MNVVVTPSAAASISRRIRVMLVDDAVVVRGLFARWVEAEPDLEVVATLRTGRDAVNQLERVDPDVVVLDVDMPELDGIAALPLLLEKKRDLVVIMASTLTRRNAEISLRALSLGAADYIPKPGSNREVSASTAFRRDLIEKIRQLGLRAKRLRHGIKARVSRPAKSAPSIVPATEEIAPLQLRQMPLTPPRVLVIGASTGGPQALNRLVVQIDTVIQRAPVLITQHMPPTFTAVLAEHLARVSKFPVREASDGEEVNAGAIYLAPGGKHLKVERRDGMAVIAIDDGPLVNFCKPAVDPLFASAAQVWGSKVLALVLTGMGSDGLAGAKEIVAAGGTAVADSSDVSTERGAAALIALLALIPIGLGRRSTYPDGEGPTSVIG